MEGERSHHTPALTTSTDGGSKLKVPKSTGEAEAEAPTPVKKSNFCHICNKRFSNGKAFGSHLSRADVQDREKLKKLKFNQSIKFKRDGSASFNTPAKGTVCIICGKDFPSKKSLFGDMRCHPERQYRDNMTYYHDVDVAAACATLTAMVAAVDLTDQSLSRKHDGDDQLISLVNGDALHLNPKEEHKSANSKLYGNKNKFSTGQELDEMQIEPQNHNLVVKKK
ncbi:hypothetical protein ACH5RR_021397 [Cinchona calisaya]|uniref:C2H2-type domain-containing protein n=1 Tax=Cinchona calisaya TaxID=153742 RepID=A0ABD2ZM56_9GENT